MSSETAGRCLCGSVRFVANGEPKGVAWRGAIAKAAAGIAARPFLFSSRVTPNTVTEGEITRFNSSPGRLRGFCARCGSTLTCEGESSPKYIFISGCSHSMTPPNLSPRNSSFRRNACHGSP
jgi:hypothetical protein